MPMDIAEILSLFTARMRVEVEYPGARRELGDHTVRTIEEGRGCVIYSSLEGRDLDAAIEAELARFRELGLLGELEWKLHGSDRPAELRERLEAHGFVAREPADAILVLDLAELPEGLRVRGEHDIRKVEGRKGIEELLSVAEAVWPGPEHQGFARWLSASVEADPSRTSLYVAYADGKPVAEGRIDFADSLFSGLWGGATLPGHRGRGIYTALVAARAAEALSRGVRFLTIDAGPMSRSILEKRGFRLLDTALEMNWRGDRD